MASPGVKRAPVTRDEIFAAADSIKAGGQEPTLDAIRQKIGGSFSTLSPALSEWRDLQASAAKPLQDPAPDELYRSLTGVVDEFWSIAIQKANAKLAGERTALEQARERMAEYEREMTALADRLQTRIEDLEAEAEKGAAAAKAAEASAVGTIASLQAQLADRETALHTEATRTQVAEARALEIEKKAAAIEKRVAASDVELARVRDDLELERGSAAQLRADLRDALSAARTHEQHAIAVAGDLDRARAEISSMREDLAATRTAAHDQERRAIGLAATVESMKAAAAAESARLQQEIDTARSALEDAGRALTQANAQAEAAQAAQSDALHERDAAREAAAAAQNAAAAAREELARARGELDALRAYAQQQRGDDAHGPADAADARQTA